MEKLLYFHISAILSISSYGIAWQLVKKDSAKNYVDKHPWLHPNWICAWRTFISLVGFLVFFTSQHSLSLFIGIFLFIFGAALDAVDGLIARKCDKITEFGKYLDPFCDKVVYLVPLIVFAYYDYLPIWKIWLLTFIEACGQFLIRPFLQKKSRNISANIIGKAKAVCCFSLVIICMLAKNAELMPKFTDFYLDGCIALAIGSILLKFK